MILLSSCLGTKHLQDDQYLLRKQKIKGAGSFKKEELEVFIKQEPNKKLPLIPFTPYVWVYQQGLKLYDKEKTLQKIEKINKKYERRIDKARKKGKEKKVKRLTEKKRRKISKKEETLENGNQLMRWGEPLAIFDKLLTEQTNQQFELYLKTKGYFNASSEYKIRYRDKKAYVTYHLSQGAPHLVDTFFVSADNANILSIISANEDDRFIEEGAPYDQELLSRERDRVETLLRNNGYFDFKKQFIVYKVDTLEGNYEADIEMVIRDPERGNHKIFTIDSVIFVTDAGEKGVGQRQRTAFNGINYQFYEDEYSRKVLDQRIFIYPGTIYSKQRTLDTQTQLANLDNFKFININYDSSGGQFLANIFASALPKYQITNELGVNVTEGLPGPFYQFSLKNRNVFKGLENIELSGYFGFEGVASATDNDNVYSSTEAGAKLSINFPQFLIPGFGEWKRGTGHLNPNTTLRTGFDFIDRPEYRRAGFNASWLYNWKNYKRDIVHNLKLFEVGLINSQLSDTFDIYLDTLTNLGNNLRTSFDPSFISSISYLVTFNFDPIYDLNNRASFLRLFSEIGGATFNLFTPEVLVNSNLEYYQFLKGSAEYIRHVPVSDNGVVATRVKVGMAYPYGDNESLPYEKYFFSGGSNSVRAWRPRRLGPGSFDHNRELAKDSEDRYSYEDKIEQPGEILVEANIEYRNKLIGFLDWAFFIDAGNIWLIHDDPARPNGNFEPDRFYREFGIGSGLGLRFNFSFLVVRFDYGVKIYDPMRRPGQRFIGDNITLQKLGGEKGQALLNLAIGYPF